MKLSIGIVGLPNTGKSTLFNALLRKQQAQAANHPFTTIKPNIGGVEVPDKRLNKLYKIVTTEHSSWNPRKVPTTIKFIDIAGIIKGASKGEGLGNQFLGEIRNVTAIIVLIRAFANKDITHVGGKINPSDDLSTIMTELELADIQLKEKFKSQPEKMPALLAKKPRIIVANLGEADLGKKPGEFGLPEETITICAKTENELALLKPQEQKEYLSELGQNQAGLNILVSRAYNLLSLKTFFTQGEREVRAWSTPKSALAPQAAGEIHSDFEKKFISSEVLPFKTFIQYRSWEKAKNAGAMRKEGRNYLLKDGDIVNFLIGK